MPSNIVLRTVATQMISSQNGESFSGSTGLLNWNLSYQAGQNVVQLQTSGPIDKISFPAMLSAAVAVAEQKQCLRILMDHSNSTLQLNPLEIYYAPKVIVSSGAGANYSLALVFSEMTEDLQFMENVCRNSGLRLAVFTDINVGLEWLSASMSPPAAAPYSVAIDAESSNC